MTTLPIPDEALNSHIGILGKTPTSDPLAIDVDRLIGSHACIVANSGGGKSGLIRRLLEVTHGRVQHIVLDGEDEFYTLRERYDYVIAGGEGGDVPAPVASAEGLAIGALTHGFSLIVQLNDLGFDGAPDFIGRFLTAMVTAPRHLWHPVLVVVDEAQRFVPRQGTTAASAGVRALIAQGRKRGFTAVLAGTKFTEIDPAARGGVNNWMLGRVGQAVDRNTMADQLGFTAKEGRERLGRMEPRSFWAFGPALAQEPVLFHVADVETTPIHAGQAKVPTPPAPEALRAILQGLAVTEVPADAQGPGDKHEGSVCESAHVRTLEAEAAQLEGERDDLLVEVEKLRGERDHFKTGFEDYRSRIHAALHALGVRSMADLDDEEWANSLKRIPAPQREDPAPPPRREEPRKPEAPTPVPPRARQAQGLADGETSIPATSRKMIDALARFYPRALPIEHVAKIAGVSMKSSLWRTTRSGFVDSGLVEPFAGSQWRISAEGVDRLGLQPVPDSPVALLQFWTSSFTPATAAMLRVLVAAAGERLPRDEVASRAGVSLTSSGLSGGLRELREHGLILADSDGYRASEVLL